MIACVWPFFPKRSVRTVGTIESNRRNGGGRTKTTTSVTLKMVRQGLATLENIFFELWRDFSEYKNKQKRANRCRTARSECTCKCQSERSGESTITVFDQAFFNPPLAKGRVFLVMFGATELIADLRNRRGPIPATDLKNYIPRTALSSDLSPSKQRRKKSYKRISHTPCRTL